MRFYDREKELEILQTNWEQTTDRGRLTVLVGRRRIGKTTILTKSAEDVIQPMLYLYVSKDNERVLTGKFQEAAEHTGRLALPHRGHGAYHVGIRQGLHQLFEHSSISGVGHDQAE